MTKYGTIKIPKEEYERHNAKRQNLNETWAEYIDGQAPDIETGVPDDVEEQLDRIEDAATTAEERTGSIERTLEDVNR